LTIYDVDIAAMLLDDYTRHGDYVVAHVLPTAIHEKLETSPTLTLEICTVPPTLGTVTSPPLV
jgi:hypothetical protein